MFANNEVFIYDNVVGNLGHFSLINWNNSKTSNFLLMRIS
jgi:hypothetical protein